MQHHTQNIDTPVNLDTIMLFLYDTIYCTYVNYHVTFTQPTQRQTNCRAIEE